jgi:hypothetical protein
MCNTLIRCLSDFLFLITQSFFEVHFDVFEVCTPSVSGKHKANRLEGAFSNFEFVVLQIVFQWQNNVCRMFAKFMAESTAELFSELTRTLTN